METYFEITDNNGVIESPIDTFVDAQGKLSKLFEEGFEFSGDIKIVEVHHITR